MRLLWILSACLVVLADAGTALGCSAPSYMLFFEFKSADLNKPQQAATIDFVRQRFKLGLPSSCQRLMVSGHADTAEAATPEIRLDVARAEAVRDALERQGIPRDAIETKGMMGTLLVPTGPDVREPQNRNASIVWGAIRGRRLCDPASKQMPPTLCHGMHRSCYWEMADGTICNFDNVPDPNPARYSVVEYSN